MKKLLFCISVLLFLSCNKDEVEGIKLGNTLTENQSTSENKILVEVVRGVLDQKPGYLSTLLKLNCGGAAGCYDLGSVITQIINKVGEENFSKMTNELNDSEKANLKDFITAGLEYGFPLNEKKQNEKFEIQFPSLYRKLQFQINR